MRTTAEMAAGLAVLVALALGATWLQAALVLPVPGPVLGLLAYLLLLASGRMDWTLPAARLLGGLIGAFIVPALVGIALFDGVLRPALLPLALVLLASTAVTAVATAMFFRLAGGRG